MAKLPTGLHITYQLQYRKCGKPSCGTCKRGPGHGPYWYAYWREGARLRSGYIGKICPADVSPAIVARAEARESEAVMNRLRFTRWLIERGLINEFAV